MVQLLIKGSDRVTRTRALSLSMEQVDSCISRILLAHGCAAEFENRDYLDYPCYDRPGHDNSLIAPIVRAINAGNVDMVRLLVKQRGPLLMPGIKGCINLNLHVRMAPLCNWPLI